MIEFLFFLYTPSDIVRSYILRDLAFDIYLISTFKEFCNTFESLDERLEYVGDVIKRVILSASLIGLLMYERIQKTLVFFGR